MTNTNMYLLHSSERSKWWAFVPNSVHCICTLFITGYGVLGCRGLTCSDKERKTHTKRQFNVTKQPDCGLWHVGGSLSVCGEPTQTWGDTHRKAWAENQIPTFLPRGNSANRNLSSGSFLRKWLQCTAPTVSWRDQTGSSRNVQWMQSIAFLLKTTINYFVIFTPSFSARRVWVSCCL